MIKEDVCAEGKVPQLVHVLRAGEPILKCPFEIQPHLKTHTCELHIMHAIITECVMDYG
jgi:hypothetical protein